MANARRRSQPYRLDWQGTAKDNEQLNIRLKKLWTDADEMFQILFDDLRRADEAINNITNTTITSSTSIYPFGAIPGPRGNDGEDGETVVIGSSMSSGSGTITAAQVQAVGYWSPLTNGDLVAPELIFANGDTIAVFTPTP